MTRHTAGSHIQSHCAENPQTLFSQKCVALLTYHALISTHLRARSPESRMRCLVEEAPETKQQCFRLHTA